MTGHSPLDMPVGAAMVAVALLVSILLLTAWAADAHDRARRRREQATHNGCMTPDVRADFQQWETEVKTR